MFLLELKIKSALYFSSAAAVKFTDELSQENCLKIQKSQLIYKRFGKYCSMRFCLKQREIMFF